MHRLLLAVALCLNAGPALAAWNFSDLSDDTGLAYSGWARDSAGAEVEVYCDDWLPGMVDLTIYPGQAVTTPIADAIPVEVTVTADSGASLHVSMYIDDLDGQLILYTSNMDTGNFEDMLLLIARSETAVTFAAPDRSHTFPTEGALDVIGQLANICPS